MIHVQFYILEISHISIYNILLQILWNTFVSKDLVTGRHLPVKQQVITPLPNVLVLSRTKIRNCLSDHFKETEVKISSTTVHDHFQKTNDMENTACLCSS